MLLRLFLSSGAMFVRYTDAVAKNTPCTTAVNARVTNKRPYEGAIAEATFNTANVNINHVNKRRRATRPTKLVAIGAPTACATA